MRVGRLAPSATFRNRLRANVAELVKVQAATGRGMAVRKAYAVRYVSESLASKRS